MNNHITEYADIETGEIRKGVIISEEQWEYLQNKKKCEQKRYIIERHNTKRNKEGYFYMIKYQTSKMLNMGISLSDVTRIMYLATYMSYDNKLMYDNKIVIKKEGLQKILKLNHTAFYNFLNDVCGNNILIETNNCYYLNDKIFHRGKTIKSKNNCYMFFYHNIIRALYENSTSREHKLLAYLFLLFPFVNIYHNVLCKNPDEKDLSKLDLMTFSDIGQIIGISNTKKISSDLRNYIIDGHYVIAQVLVGKKRYIYINPKLFSTAYCNIDTVYDTLVAAEMPI